MYTKGGGMEAKCLHLRLPGNKAILACGLLPEVGVVEMWC